MPNRLYGVIVVFLPLLMGCDPRMDKIQVSAYDVHGPLSKIEYTQAGSTQFQAEITQAGASFRFSILKDGLTAYLPGDLAANIDATNSNYSLLKSIFEGTTGFRTYVNACPSCPSGYWETFTVFLKKDGSQVQVDVDQAVKEQLEHLINSAYIKLVPPMGTYSLATRSCRSGAPVSDALSLPMDAMTIDFVSSTQAQLQTTIGGVTSTSLEPYSILESTLTLGGEILGISLSRGRPGAEQLTIITEPFTTSSGSCPRGDRLISVFN